MNNAKLTLICPTLNRHSFLKKSLSFWSKTDCVVLVADGSSKRLKSSVLNSENIFYYHLRTGLKERIHFLLEQIQTPYSCLITDDDIYLPSGFKKCISFLDKNNDYSSVIGRAIGFSTYKKKLFYKLIYRSFMGRDLSSNSTIQRLLEHFGNFTPSHCHSVMRTEVFKYSFYHAMNSQIDIYAITEIINEFLVVCGGKSKVLPYLHWLRSFDAEAIRDTGDIGMNRNLKFEYWWPKKKFKNQKKLFCKNLSKLSNGTVNEKEIQYIFDKYVLDHSLKGKIIQIIKNTLSQLIKDKIFLLVSFLKKLKKEVLKSKKINSKVFFELENEGVYINYSEIKLFESVFQKK